MLGSVMYKWFVVVVIVPATKTKMQMNLSFVESTQTFKIPFIRLFVIPYLCTGT